LPGFKRGPVIGEGSTPENPNGEKSGEGAKSRLNRGLWVNREGGLPRKVSEGKMGNNGGKIGGGGGE